MRVSKLIIGLLIFSLYSCYRCDEAEDFFWTPMAVALVDANTETTLPQQRNDIQIFRNGVIDSTEIEMGSNYRLRIDDWEIEEFVNNNGQTNTDTFFTLEYHIHFLTDTISPNQINVDTLSFRYSIMDTNCNVLGIDEIEVGYNSEVVQIGGFPFYTIRI